MAGLAAALEQLPAAADGDGRVWSYCGLVHRADGDLAGFVEAYRRAASLRSHNEPLLYRLALAERRLGHREQTEALLARSQALRDARNGLLDALQAYGQAIPQGGSSAPGPELAA